ncbi:MAG: response regulator [Deltaproteobacteria bacterium]|nr:response regulator [Deltaproteobacteria bacterium]
MSDRGMVLIVDDEIGPVESMRMILKPHHHVDTAGSGAEALRMLSQKQYDVVTLDLNMPDMHGIDVLKKIREDHEEVEVIVVTGYGTLTTAQQALRYNVFDYITKPFDVSDLIRVADAAVQKKRLRQESHREISEFQCMSHSRDERQAREVAIEVPLQNACSYYHDLSLMDFIKVLSRILEEKSPSMHYHSVRVDRFSRVIAEEIGLPRQERDYLTIAAFLHDIGKVGINNSTLNKAGALSAHEWEEMREHPSRGVELVRPLCLPEEVLSIILHHHESYDGSGYPHGLKGNEIPLCARIIGIIDSYDAMISNRPYRKARPMGWVIRELRDCAGTQFDPEIIDVFINCLQYQQELQPVQACQLSL